MVSSSVSLVSQKFFGGRGVSREKPSFSKGIFREVHVLPQTVQTINRFYHFVQGPLVKGGQCTLVPRLFSVSIPRDIRQVKNSQNRREVFIKMVLPLVLKVNEEVLEQRARLLAIGYRQKRALPVAGEDRLFLQEIARTYRMTTVSVEGLLKRVDQVPPSLALAQAILETGCGTSCAALNKHSIFGHMATLTKVKSFSSLSHSVYAYVRNLNRHTAYHEFRLIRHRLRKSNKPLSGHSLAVGLMKYSIRGQDYIKDLQKLIRLYNLEKFDGAALQPQTEI
jgi:Bax protein